MPLLRYKMGDQIAVEQSNSACACGRKKTPIITQILGRTHERIRLPSGREITHPDINMLIGQMADDTALTEYQLLATEGDANIEFEIQIVSFI